MNGFDHSQRQHSLSLKRRSSHQLSLADHRQEIRRSSSLQEVILNGMMRKSGSNNSNSSSSCSYGFNPNENYDLVSAVVPAVTVVLEGRSICQLISLHKHDSYASLAKALREMFAGDNDHNNNDDAGDVTGGGDDDLDLSNAVPGHLVAYEDMENDLLLAGDLSWKDFVRVAKRIRILPSKSNSRKPGSEVAV